VSGHVADWLPVKDAPRTGKPVILWVEDPEAPPVYTVTAGVWEEDKLAGGSFWRVFSSLGGSSIYLDEHIRGWVPMPVAGLRR